MGAPANRQGTSVERAADLFTSLAAAGERLTVAQFSEIAGEHAFELAELVDALAFLEATGLVAFETVLTITRRA